MFVCHLFIEVCQTCWSTAKYLKYCLRFSDCLKPCNVVDPPTVSFAPPSGIKFTFTNILFHNQVSQKVKMINDKVHSEVTADKAVLEILNKTIFIIYILFQVSGTVDVH